jgi:anti-sigma factor RsiW
LNAYFDGELPMAKRQVLDRLLVTDAALRLRAAEVAERRSWVRLAYATTMAE